MSIILIIYKILSSACALHMLSLTVLNIQKLSIFSPWSRRPACRPPPPAHPPLCTWQIVVSCHWTGTTGQTSVSHGDLCAFEAQPFQCISLRFDALSCRICFCCFLLGSYVDVDLWICECVVVCVCGTTTKEIVIWCNLRHTHRIVMKVSAKILPHHVSSSFYSFHNSLSIVSCAGRNTNHIQHHLTPVSLGSPTLSFKPRHSSKQSRWNTQLQATKMALPWSPKSGTAVLRCQNRSKMNQNQGTGIAIHHANVTFADLGQGKTQKTWIWVLCDSLKQWWQNWSKWFQMIPCERNEHHGNSAIAVVKHPGLSKVVPHCALHLLPRYGLAQSIFDLHQWICWDQGRLLRLMISTCSVHLSVVSRPQKAKAPSNPLLANRSAAQPFQPRQVIKLNCRRNIPCDNSLW